MRRAARWSVLAVAIVAMCAAMSAAPSTASAGRNVPGAPGTTIDDSGTTTVPESSAPESTPDTTEPDDSVPSTSTEETLIAAGDPDDDVDATTAVIAIVGFILLVAVASWWMVRRSDPDAEPMPRRDGQTGPPSDLI